MLFPASARRLMSRKRQDDSFLAAYLSDAEGSHAVLLKKLPHTFHLQCLGSSQARKADALQCGELHNRRTSVLS
jgi:hypothetical protein